jgi:hypothetical protein
MLTIIAAASFVCALVVAGVWTGSQSPDTAQQHLTHDLIASVLALVVILISMVAFFGAATAEYCGAVIVPTLVAARMVQTVAAFRAQA